MFNNSFYKNKYGFVFLEMGLCPNWLKQLKLLDKNSACTVNTNFPSLLFSSLVFNESSREFFFSFSLVFSRNQT